MTDGSLSAEKAAVKELSHRYAVALDQGDLEAWRNLFHEDILFTSDAAPPRRLAEVLAIPEKQLERYSRTLHQVSTQIVEIDGSSATGKVYCTAHHFSETSHLGERYTAGLCHTFNIDYDDRYIKEGGRWMFIARHVDVVGRTISSVI